MTVRRCGEALLNLLETYGVEHIFGIPGVHTLELYRGLARSRIKHVLARHEQGAAFMADGYARVSGRPGVCALISGPGVTNAATAIAEAYADSVPMLVLSSAIPSAGLGQGWGYLHEITDQAAVTRPFTGASRLVRAIDDIPEQVAAAFSSFATERPRPVHLSIPTDLLAAPISHSWSTIEVPAARAPEAGAVHTAAVLLAKAERPAILIGGGGRATGEPVLAIAEMLQAPVVTTIAGKGAVDPRSPLAAGSPLWTQPGRRLLEEADLVLGLGTEIAPTDLLRDRLELRGRVVRVDLDPRKCGDTRYHTALAIEADARATAAAILDALAIEGGKPRCFGPDSGWGAARVARCRAKVAAILGEVHRDRLGFLDAIREAVPENTVLVNDMTQLAYTGNTGYPLPPSGRWLYPSGYGTLGYALPAAIGAKLGGGQCPVVAIAGDSGVLYTVSEMGTAAQLGLPILLLVWNNRGLGQIAESMSEVGIAPIATDAIPPDFKVLARAFGWQYGAARNPEQLADSLRRHVWQGKSPLLVEVVAG